jgi:hypothetical protein
MDMDVNYQKIIKKQKIKLFKSGHYFEYFKSLLLSFSLPNNTSSKKEKVYNLIKSKHSLQVNPTKKYWSLINISLQKPSVNFSDEMSILEEQYLLYFCKIINKHLYSLSIIHSVQINVLKQEYLNLCIKLINNTRNRRMRTLRMLSKKNVMQLSSDAKNINNENNDNNNNDKSSEDDDNEENNYKKYFKNKKPKTLLEKEIFRLKVKSSNQVVDEFIGDIKNERLEKDKKEINFLNFIKNRKNKIFRHFLSNQTKKNFLEIIESDMKEDLKFKNLFDNREAIFPLEMKIKNDDYCKSKKKREREKYFSTINSKVTETNNNTINTDNYCFSPKTRPRSSKNKGLIKNKFLNNSNNTKKRRILNSAKVRNHDKSVQNSTLLSSKLKNNVSFPLLTRKNKLKKKSFCTINKNYFINKHDLFY